MKHAHYFRKRRKEKKERERERILHPLKRTACDSPLFCVCGGMFFLSSFCFHKNEIHIFIVLKDYFIFFIIDIT